MSTNEPVYNNNSKPVQQQTSTGSFEQLQRVENAQSNAGVYIFHFAPPPGGGQKYELSMGLGKKNEEKRKKGEGKGKGKREKGRGKEREKGRGKGKGTLKLTFLGHQNTPLYY